MTWTSICDVPKDKTVVDIEGYTWTYRHGAWGFWLPNARRWQASRSAAHNPASADYMFGPFEEVTL